jgi:hypothetical protein
VTVDQKIWVLATLLILGAMLLAFIRWKWRSRHAGDSSWDEEMDVYENRELTIKDHKLDTVFVYDDMGRTLFEAKGTGVNLNVSPDGRTLVVDVFEDK